MKKYYYNIGAQDIDFMRRVSIKSLTNFILLTAGEDADEKGYGLLQLQQRCLTWVLSRLVIDMKRIPTEKDSISISTWVSEAGAVFTTRNFKIWDASGNEIGYATSSWAIMDMNTRHGMPLTIIPSIRDYVVGETSPIGVPRALPKVDGESALSFTVRYSKIDVNNHANSLYYIQWISDCFSLDFYRSHRVRRFEINYMKELTIDDKGRVYREETAPGDYFFEIVTRDKGIACRARILFEDL